MTATLTGMLLGLLVGLRHAFEPDHLTAVSTLVAEARDGRRGALLGAIWGLGHTLALVIVGCALLALGATLPAHVAAGFELAVAAMLIVLGIRAMRHRHDGSAHVHVGTKVVRWRPLVVGLVHGLAGSGALTALVFAQLPSTATRVAYLAVFGIGSIAGMAAASALAGASLHALARTGRIQRGLSVATGVVSIVVGVLWGIPMIAALAR